VREKCATEFGVVDVKKKKGGTKMPVDRWED
jgi:hypothetical protein